MISPPSATTWISRLRTEDFAETTGINPDTASEIPHVRGVPVDIGVAEGDVIVREWPNLAGRLEPVTSDDIVRWDRSLASRPPSGTILPRGDATDERLLIEMRRWLVTFIRTLAQLRGVTVAVQTETSTAIILTSSGVKGLTNLPTGIQAIPTRLAEFPGGIVLTMRASSFEQRSEYAEQVHEIVEQG